MKKIFIPIIFLVLLISSTTAIQFNENGLKIQSPSFEGQPILTNLSWGFKVFEVSTSKKLTNVNCTLDIYNHTGSNVFNEVVVSPTGSDYVFNINNSLFNEKNYYRYTVYCENSSLGGFLERDFFINDNGFLLKNNWFVVLIVFSIMIFSATILFIAKNLDEEHIFLKITFYISSLIAGFTAVGVSLSTLENTLLTSIALNNSITIYKFVAWVFALFGFYVLLYFIWKALNWLSESIKR